MLCDHLCFLIVLCHATLTSSLSSYPIVDPNLRQLPVSQLSFQRRSPVQSCCACCNSSAPLEAHYSRLNTLLVPAVVRSSSAAERLAAVAGVSQQASASMASILSVLNPSANRISCYGAQQHCIRASKQQRVEPSIYQAYNRCIPYD